MIIIVKLGIKGDYCINNSDNVKLGIKGDYCINNSDHYCQAWLWSYY